MVEEGRFLDKRITRRRLIQGATDLVTAGIIIYGLRGGLSFAPTNYDYLNISPEDRETLASLKPVTIAHAAGNSPEGIEKARNAWITLAELDANIVDDEIFVDHGINFAHGLAGFNRKTWTFRIGRPNFSLQEAFEIASTGPRKIGLFIELKRGDFKSHHIEQILKWEDAYKIPILFHGNRIDQLDRARHVSGNSEKSVYVPDGQKDWAKILEEQEKEERKAVLSNPYSIWLYGQRMLENGITIYAGDANSAPQVLALNQIGVNRFINERTNLRRLFSQSESAHGQI